jgi:AraC family transcriptional regulator
MIVAENSPPPAHQATVDPRVQRALGFLLAHVAENITLARLAKEVGVSAPHLSRLFRLELAESPHAFLTHMKMDAARKALLADERLSVRLVAWQLGRSSPSHFAKAFAQVHGSTPAIWRPRELARSRRAAAERSFRDRE